MRSMSNPFPFGLVLSHRLYSYSIHSSEYDYHFIEYEYD